MPVLAAPWGEESGWQCWEGLGQGPCCQALSTLRQTPARGRL